MNVRDDVSQKTAQERRDACVLALRKRGNRRRLEELLRGTRRLHERELDWAAEVFGEVLRLGAMAGALPGVAGLHPAAVKEGAARSWAGVGRTYGQALRCELARLDLQAHVRALIAPKCTDAAAEAKRLTLAEDALRLFSEDLAPDVLRGLRLMPTAAVAAAQELLRGILELRASGGPDEELLTLTTAQLRWEWVQLRSRAAGGSATAEENERLLRLQRQLDPIAFAGLVADLVAPAWACAPDQAAAQYAIVAAAGSAPDAMDGFTPGAWDSLDGQRAEPRFVASVGREVYGRTTADTPLRPLAPVPPLAEGSFRQVIAVEHALRPSDGTRPVLAVAVEPDALGIWRDPAIGAEIIVLDARDPAELEATKARVRAALRTDDLARIGVRWDGTTRVALQIAAIGSVLQETGASGRIVAPANRIAALGGCAGPWETFWAVHTAPQP